MTTTKQGIENTINNCLAGQKLAKEILAKREAAQDTFEKERDESAFLKAGRQDRELRHLNFIKELNAIEDRFIANLEGLTERTLEHLKKAERYHSS